MLPRMEGALRVQLCGRFAVELAGERVEDALPGRQGRLLFAYLVANRTRPVGREELVSLLWPEEPPEAVESSLSALLSKLRRALGAEMLDGRSTLRLRPPAGTWVDAEAALEAIHRAETSLRSESWAAAWSAARVPLHIAPRPFLAGEQGPWIAEWRRRLADVLVRALEVTAAASLAIGGSELDTAERSARRLVEAAPFRDSGYRLLMEVLAARGNAGEALRVYEELRTRLREELGTFPSRQTQELHRALLG